MSKRYQPSTNNNSFSGVLPDIVANFKTAMCNPYDKPKVITNRSKTPVPKISTNGKSVVPASTGLPTGLFGQQNLPISKFLNLNAPHVTLPAKVPQVPQPSHAIHQFLTKLLPSSSLPNHHVSQPHTCQKLVRELVSNQNEPIILLPPTLNAMSQQPNLNSVSLPPPLLLQKSLNMFIKDRDLGHTASLHVRGMKLSGATHLTLVHMSRGSGVMTWWEQPPDQWRGPICPTCSPISQRGFSNFVLWSRVQFHQSCLPLKVRRKSK